MNPNENKLIIDNFPDSLPVEKHIRQGNELAHIINVAGCYLPNVFLINFGI